MLALALKYRPKNFDELIGQDAVSKSLTHALNENRLGHAYLFSGLRGSGKTSSARIFSKSLVCENGPTSSPCEVCSHCLMANESRHIDIIEMDAASHRKIDDIRELIEQTKYNPTIARFKIFIIDEVHMLTKEAFNALLKTLEEPPSYVKFILATTDPLKLPATVLSRTQHFRFKHISKMAIIKHLELILSKEDISYEREALEILARTGSGSLRDTLTLLDQAIVYGGQKVTQNGVASMLGLLDPSRIEELFDIVLSGDRDRLRTSISELEIYEAEMIIDEMIASLKDKFLNNDPRLSLLLCERFFRILAQAKTMLNTTSDNIFVLSIMFFMMIEALNLNEIDDTISSLKSQQNGLFAQKTANLEPNISKKEQSPYDEFIDKIYHRDYNLGECFERNTEFIEFKNNELVISSNPSGADRELIRQHYTGIILPILKSLFGDTAKITNIGKQAKSPNISQNTTISMLDNELSKINNLTSPSQTQALKQSEASSSNQSSFASLMSINANKTPQDMEKIRQENILMEAKTLFGNPKIQKIDQE